MLINNVFMCERGAKGGRDLQDNNKRSRREVIGISYYRREFSVLDIESGQRPEFRLFYQDVRIDQGSQGTEAISSRALPSVCSSL